MSLNVKCIFLCNNVPHFVHHYITVIYYNIYNTDLQHTKLLPQLRNPLSCHLYCIYKYANVFTFYNDNFLEMCKLSRSYHDKAIMYILPLTLYIIMLSYCVHFIKGYSDIIIQLCCARVQFQWLDNIIESGDPAYVAFCIIISGNFEVD